MRPDTPALALAAATALHAGFQLVVTVVVYPAFRQVRDADWPAYEAGHTRRILGVVVLVYGALAAACVWVLVTGVPDLPTWVALGASGTAALATATVAAPAHRRLTDVREERDLRRLLVADRVRLAAAVLAVVAAWWPLLTVGG